MKATINTFLILTLLFCTTAFSYPTTKITLHVIDENGKPLSGIPFQIGAVNPTVAESTYGPIVGKTENGIIKSESPSAFGEISFNNLESPGFYITSSKYRFTNTDAGKWQPWNPIVEVVLKPIVNPIAMYARKICLPNGYYMTIPATNTQVGFDLETGDWVAPYGKGSFSDFIFTMQIKTPYISMTQPYDVVWTLSFSNKGDGIQSLLVPKNMGSELRMPRNAPEVGYQPSLVQENSYDGKQWKKGGLSADQNYFFRVRTVLDGRGNVQSALYGKIAGPIECSQTGRLQFTYYLNPTVNDRNMEFDPKKNLFRNLSPFQSNLAP